jgi:hypothetical protein
MAKRFVIEKKREAYLVVNGETGDVRGRFKDRGEAQQFANHCQDQFEDGKKMVSGRLTKPKDVMEPEEMQE